MLADVEMHTLLPCCVACWCFGVVEREIQLAFRADGISRLCLGVEFQRAGDEVRCAEFVAV
jgi:hypothetical protein